MAVNSHEVWSEKDKQFIIDNWKSMTDDELASALGRTRKAIGLTRHRLKLARPNNYVTDEEKRFIKANMGKLTIRQIAEKLGKPLGTTYKIIERVCPRKNSEKRWNHYNDKDVMFLEVNWKTMSIYELAEVLGKPSKSIATKLVRDGILDREE